MKTLYRLIALIMAIVPLAGCALLQPGADPIVVHTEQTETVALSAFETAMLVDNANRAFWKTNAPAFHAWCENMRSPMVIDVTNVYPRGIAILKALDTTKLAYKQGYANSNALATALAVVETAVAEAQQFIAAGATATNIPAPMLVELPKTKTP